MMVKVSRGSQFSCLLNILPHLSWIVVAISGVVEKLRCIEYLCCPSFRDI